MQKQYVLAYDLGTSGVKGALVDASGNLAFAATCDYPYERPREGWAEQDPNDYWKGVCAVTTRLLSDSAVPAQSIMGLSFGTLWKGIIPVADGRALRKSILWLDGRSADQAERINARFPNAGYSGFDYWPKLLWLRENEPQLIEQADWILEVNSFLKWKATGVAAVDVSNSFLRSFDADLDSYYKKLLAFMDIPRQKIPPFVDATASVGTVTKQAAQELGILPGTPVFGGCNDIQAVCVGAGCARVGDVHAYFGSSGWLGFTVAHTGKPATTPFDRSRDIQMAGMKAIGLSLNWVIRTCYPELAETLGAGIYDEVNRQVSQIPAGSDAVLATPWLFGENPGTAGLDARCCFLNLSANHTRAHMARAMMEGVCYHLRQVTQRACRMKELPPPEVICAVGGGACSDVWMQMLADVLNVTVKVPNQPRHAGAIGTAYTALIGLGFCRDYEAAAGQITFDRCFHPNAENRACYDRGFEVYQTLYTTLKPIFHGKRES